MSDNIKIADDLTISGVEFEVTSVTLKDDGRAVIRLRRKGSTFADTPPARQLVELIDVDGDHWAPVAGEEDMWKTPFWPYPQSRSVVEAKWGPLKEVYA